MRPLVPTKRLAASFAVGATAIAAAGTVALSANGANAPTPAPDPVATSASRTLTALASTGSRLSATQTAKFASMSSTFGVNVDVARGRNVTPPAGEAAGKAWVVLPASDGSACLDVSGSSICGGAKDVAATGLGAMSISQPDTKIADKDAGAAIFAAGGTAHLTGFAPVGTASVDVLSPSGSVVAKTASPDLTYKLDVATEDLGTLEFRDINDAVIGAKKIR